MNKRPDAHRPHGPSLPSPETPGTPVTWSPAAAVRIDPEFHALIPPLSADERARLEDLLLVEGCRDPLVVWAGFNILLDGHNRLDICLRHGLPFAVAAIDLPDREAARAWIIEHQMSRRNLTDLGRSYVRGKRYLALKHQGQRHDLTSGQKNGSPAPAREGAPSTSGTACRKWVADGPGEAGKSTSGRSCPKWTAERLAAEYQVSERTIRNDALFAAAVDVVAGTCGEEARRLILTGEGQVSRGDVAWWAEQPPEAQRQLLQCLLATGRLVRPADPGRSGKFLVPRESEALAHTVLARLGREDALRAYQALRAVLGLAAPDGPEERPEER